MDSAQDMPGYDYAIPDRRHRERVRRGVDRRQIEWEILPCIDGRTNCEQIVAAKPDHPHAPSPRLLHELASRRAHRPFRDLVITKKLRVWRAAAGVREAWGLP